MKMIANLIKVGNVIKYKEKMFQVLNTNTIKPGKGGAFIQVEMRDIKSGNKINERFRTSENIEKLSVNEISATFLFIDNSNITVMKNDDYEQISLDESLLVGSKEFLADGTQLSLELIGDEIVGIKLPKSIVVEIESADAVVKGQTASSSFKNARTTNNVRILVPPHIKEGDKVLINTENNEYVEKAKK
jgi:elongation factor P|tara:strand:+ start:4116 stop:4682 length:567 start_codon:yes stop_codon:yes gene_type:complete